MPTKRACGSCWQTGFAIESLERVESEAHLHCLCVARKVRAMSAPQRVLVIGGLGFIGVNLTERLVGRRPAA